jgi:Tol biopolymer transport system component
MQKQMFCIYGSIWLAIAALQPASICAAVQETSPTSSPLPAPQVFAPGIISGPASEGAPTFSPDGKTLFFTRSATRWSIILESHKNGDGAWSKPAVAPFSGEWSDASPAFSPDGSYLIFVSVRPAPASSANSGARQAESHIWRVDRTTTGWSTPVELPETVNCFPGIFRPSVASDGAVYFTAAVKGKNLSLFRAAYRNGSFMKAEPLSFSDGSIKDVDPEIAPDQSFMVFSSRRAIPGDDQHEHLFLVRNRNGQWSSPEPVRYAGDGSSEDNDPRLGRDLRTIYFSSDRSAPVHFPRTHQQAIEDTERLDQWDNSNANIWTIPLSPL